MSVIDFLELFVMTETIIIWDRESEENVFEGEIEDIPAELEYKEVCSVDWPNGKELVINIDLGE